MAQSQIPSVVPFANRERPDSRAEILLQNTRLIGGCFVMEATSGVEPLYGVLQTPA